MTLSLFTDYSLRVLMYAALPGRDRFSLDDVSAAYGVSRDHVAKVVQFLVRAGYLSSQRGRGGGIGLGRRPEEISIGAVVRETEGDAPILECFAPRPSRCRLTGCCRLQATIGRAVAAFYAVLEEVTLADVVQQPELLALALSPR